MQEWCEGDEYAYKKVTGAKVLVKEIFNILPVVVDTWTYTSENVQN